MRSIGCILVLIAYCFAFSIYIYELPRHNWAPENVKIFYSATTVIMVLFCMIDARMGFESWWHRQFNLICNLALVFNFIFIILTHMQILSDPELTFFIFNGSVIAVSLMILISAKRHGEFNN